MEKISLYPAITLPLLDEDLIDISQYISPGVYQTVKLTYAELLSELSAWKQGGNAWGETGTIGTTDNEELSFIVNSTQKMKITTDGTVIINNIDAAIALICTADGFLPIAAIQNDLVGGTTAISAENFSANTQANAGSFTMRNTLNNGISKALNLTELLTSGTSSDGIGIGIDFSADTTTSDGERMGSLSMYWEESTHVDRTSGFVFKTVTDATTEAEVMRLVFGNLIFNGPGAVGISSYEGCMFVGNTTVSGASVTDGYIMYSEDIGAGDAVPHFLNEQGDLIKLFTVNRANAYVITNGTTDRGYDANTVAVAELADVVYTLIKDLASTGLILSP